MGNVDNDAIVTIYFNLHDDLSIDQAPYKIEDNSIVWLNDRLTINPAVNYASDEIIVLFKTVKLAHFYDQHSLVPDMIRFMESCGFSFYFYGNTISSNIEDVLEKIFSELDMKDHIKLNT